MKRNDGLFFRVICILLLFFVIVSAVLYANYLASDMNDPYHSFFMRLKPDFLMRTVLILFVSSIFYIPISYGISYYFWQSTLRRVGFLDFLFVLRRPVLLVKAILLRFVGWLVRGIFGLVMLLSGAVVEVGICILSLLKTKSFFTITLLDVFDWLRTLPQQQNLFWLSVLVWTTILIGMLLVRIRFSFGKYAIICYTELSVLEAFHIGLRATRGNTLTIVTFWVKNFTYYILKIISFGILTKYDYRREAYSTMAVRFVTNARRAYFREKT